MKITSGAPAHLVHSQLVLLLLVQLAVEGLKLVLLPLPDLFLGGALLPVEARPVPPQGGGGAPRPGEGRCLCGHTVTITPCRALTTTYALMEYFHAFIRFI